MKDYKIFAVADSVTDTLQFDVIETATGSQVKSGDVPVTPTIDMFQMPSGLGFKQQLDIVEGDTIDYVVTQTIKKKNIKLNLLWSGSLSKISSIHFLACSLYRHNKVSYPFVLSDRHNQKIR